MAKGKLKLVRDLLEDEWDVHGNANLKYDIEDRNGYLYLQNINLCKLEDIIKVEQDCDAMIINLKDKTSVYVIIQWAHPEDAFISQMYIRRDAINKSDIMLYNIITKY